jgi:dCTP deaminase|tara:strand:- start:541 stop:666 length:126 start_codon:yes stop_codon:yes gene_type:complete
LYANSGAAQILFFKGEQPEVSYADRNGKYQNQTGITLAKSK